MSALAVNEAGAGSSVLLADQLKDLWHKGPDLEPEGASEKELGLIPGLRKKMLESYGIERPPDNWRAHFYKRGTLLKFLRARDLNEEKAFEMIRNSIDWFGNKFATGRRMKGDFWDIMRQAEVEDSREDKEHFATRPYGPFGFDKRGAPVLYIRYGYLDDVGVSNKMKGLESDVQTLGELVDSGKGWPRGPGVNAWVRQFFLKAIRNGLHAAKLAQQAGVTHMGVIQVWDLKDSGLTRARANWPFMQYILAGFQALDNFPEATKTIYFVNAPWWMSAGITIISNFLPPRTRGKLKAFSNRESWLEAMGKEIDLGQIPDFIGGSSTAKWEHGIGTMGEVLGEDLLGKEGVMQFHVSTAETVSKTIKKGETCIFEFKMMENSDCIDYSVSANGAEIVPKTRLTAEDGWSVPFQFTATENDETEIAVNFDNSFAWVYSKDVLYRFMVTTLNQGEKI
jgi:hypothetical protein